MQLHESECMGEYDFDHIAYFAKKRFIDCRDTIVLLAENNIVIKERISKSYRHKDIDIKLRNY